MKAVLGTDVWKWPEFRALMDRLGVEERPLLRRVVLDICYDGVAEVTETFLCKEQATKETK